MTIADKLYPMPSLIRDWLKEAKDEHTKFEQNHGVDAHWEDWYALFIRYRMDGIGRETASGFATLDVLAKPAVK